MVETREQEGQHNSETPENMKPLDTKTQKYLRCLLHGVMEGGSSRFRVAPPLWGGSAAHQADSNDLPRPGRCRMPQDAL